jgi:hypothetical protein
MFDKKLRKIMFILVDQGHNTYLTMLQNIINIHVFLGIGWAYKSFPQETVQAERLNSFRLPPGGKQEQGEERGESDTGGGGLKFPTEGPV